MEQVNIVTLKWGDRYPALFVNRLHRAVARNLNRPFRFLCFTEDPSGLDAGIEAFPLPDVRMPDSHYYTPWMKLGLFQTGMGNMQGECLFLDLDLLIIDNIDCFFEYMPGKRCIIHNWIQGHLVFKKRPDIGNSSVFRWTAGTTQFIVDKFYAEADWAMANFRPPQTYLTYGLGEKYYWPAEWATSFKRHAIPTFPLNLLKMPQIPPGTRILVFHGFPDPDQALDGYRPKGRPHRHCLPTPWITDYWDDGPEPRTGGPVTSDAP